MRVSKIALGNFVITGSNLNRYAIFLRHGATLLCSHFVVSVRVLFINNLSVR